MTMRRADREVTDLPEILDIMKKCDVCRLALNGDDGVPYLVPLNFGMEEENGVVTLYFHSAPEGKKLELMEKDDRASFEMDTGHQLQYFRDRGYCTMAYESVTGKGRLSLLPEEEKKDALCKIMTHYHPEGEAPFNPAAIPRTVVWKLTVETMTAKRKKPKAE